MPKSKRYLPPVAHCPDEFMFWGSSVQIANGGKCYPQRVESFGGNLVFSLPAPTGLSTRATPPTYDKSFALEAMQGLTDGAEACRMPGITEGDLKRGRVALIAQLEERQQDKLFHFSIFSRPATRA